tara:strand:+ start:170 stop:499 length:330 start_codon:yes stop_codon:yes gene_type:complete
MVIIVWITPPKTPPVTPSKVMIAQFIPCAAGALGSPKQVAQPNKLSGVKASMKRSSGIWKILFTIYMCLNLLYAEIPYAASPAVKRKENPARIFEVIPGLDGCVISKMP